MIRTLSIGVLLAVLCNSMPTDAGDRGWAASIAWSPDGDTIAVGSTTGIWLFDNDFNEVGYVQVKQGEGEPARALAWNAPGDLLAVGYPKAHSGGPIQIIDVRKRKIITEIQPYWHHWTPLRWHPSENHIVTGTYVGETQIWDAVTGEELFYFAESSGSALPNSTVTFCWNNEEILTVVTELEIYTVDIAEDTLLKAFDPEGLLTNADCNRGHQVISATGLLLDLQTGSYRKLDFEGHDPPFGYYSYTLDVVWSPDSRKFVASREGCHVRIYDGKDGELLADLSGGIYYEQLGYSFFQGSIGWHPNSSRFAVVGQFGDIRVWDADTFELLQRFDGFGIEYEILMLSADEVDSVKCPEGLNWQSAEKQGD